MMSYRDVPGDDPAYLAQHRLPGWLKTASMVLPTVQKTLKASIVAVLSMPAYVIAHETGHVIAGNLMGITIYDVKINWWEQSGVTYTIPGSVPGNLILGCSAGYGTEVILALFFAWHGRQLRLPAIVFGVHSLLSLGLGVINRSGDTRALLENNAWSVILLLMLGALLALTMVAGDLIKNSREPLMR